MNNRYLLCLLICSALTYFAVPRIDPAASGMEGIFAVSWLAFAILVFAGNLAALLFPHRHRKRYAENSARDRKRKERMRAN